MSDKKLPILILGTGAEARIALDIANDLDILVYGFITSEESELRKEMNDILVVAELGSEDSDTLLKDENIKMVLAEADLEQRELLSEQLATHSSEVINLIHPLARFSPFSQMGKGNILNTAAVVLANAEIGDFNWIGCHVSIGADAVIGDYCNILDGVRIGEGVVIERQAFIGAGAIIQKGIRIGEKVMIAPGAVVMTDIPDGATAFGNPAQVSK
ncbi:MAG: DapH/DapD/GlmU-related protein [Bacteroidia bacterium]|nr:DapH/DapD/GlmU-related protein [Bacteroidia bacterium]